MIPTVAVVTKIHYSDGSPATGAFLIAEMQSASQDTAGYIASKVIKSVVDSNGDVTLNLWPNDAGISPTFYKIYAEDECLGRLLDMVAIIPQSSIPLQLDDIAMPINTLSLGQTSGNVASVRRVDTNEGIKGGGDLSTNRTHGLDLTTITTEETLPTGDWIIPVQDPNAPGAIRYAKLGNLPGIGFDTVENYTSVAGQTEIYIVTPFSPNRNQLDVYINGIYQCPDDYVEDLIVDLVYAGKVILNTPIATSGLEICVKIKQNSPFAYSADAASVTYAGGGSVEDALNTLFSTTGNGAWAVVSGNTTVTSGAKIFVSTDSGSLTVTLPLSPNVNDSIKIIDITHSMYVNEGNDLDFPFTIAGNGQKIMELNENLIIDQARASIELIYTGTNFGWALND